MQSEPAAAIEETPDIYGAFPRLSEQQIETLAAHGERRPTAVGDVLFREGDQCLEFFVVLAGQVAVVQDYGGEQQTIRIHGPRRFLGELGVLTRQVSFLTTVVIEAGAVLVVPVPRLRSLMADEPVLGDLILRAYLIRRSMLVSHGAGFRIIGSRYSPESQRIREFAARNRLPHRYIDVEQDWDAENVLRDLGVRPDELPIVIWRGREILRNPRTAELARLTGLAAPGPPDAVCDLVIVGAGPGGLGAGVYGASEGLATVILDALATGGQAASSERIENYLGFPSGISGADLAERAVIQAEKFGARIDVGGEATALERRGGHYGVRLRDGRVAGARSVILATGARYKKLKIPDVERFERTSIYYAATKLEVLSCANFDVAVVGGGNSAGQAALEIARQALTIKLIVRGADLGQTMSRYLVDRIMRHPRVELLLHTEVRHLLGDERLTSLIVEDTQTGHRRSIPADALFVFIGAEPHTRWLSDEIALDEHGFVLTGDHIRHTASAIADGHPRPATLETSARGVFAVGDVRSGSVKRLASAVGEGAMAVRLAHEYLSHGGGI